MADSAVLLRLLQVDAAPCTTAAWLNVLEREPRYKRRNARFVFGEWLALHKR